MINNAISDSPTVSAALAQNPAVLSKWTKLPVLDGGGRIIGIVDYVPVVAGEPMIAAAARAAVNMTANPKIGELFFNTKHDTVQLEITSEEQLNVVLNMKLLAYSKGTIDTLNGASKLPGQSKVKYLLAAKPGVLEDAFTSVALLEFGSLPSKNDLAGNVQSGMLLSDATPRFIRQDKIYSALPSFYSGDEREYLAEFPLGK